MIGNIHTIKELSAFLMIDQDELQAIQPDKHYSVFKIPKPGSTEKRTIETPTGKLETILHRLCDGLQWLYLDHKTDAAYGFIRDIKNDPDKRNIYTNAQKHLNHDYLLNIDFDHFFYQVDENKIANIFADYNIFSLLPDTEKLLIHLVAFKGRLPMGSPTSPPLSNFATIQLDIELSKWSEQNKITYTRYVDDLSFSSKFKITEHHFSQITELLNIHRFKVNPNKMKWYDKDEIKKITGLIVGKSVTVPDEFISSFENELIKLKDLFAYALQYPDYHVLEWITKLKQVLNGRLAFIQMIYGKNHLVYLNFRKQLENIDNAEMIEQSVSWRYAGYEYH